MSSSESMPHLKRSVVSNNGVTSDEAAFIKRDLATISDVGRVTDSPRILGSTTSDGSHSERAIVNLELYRLFPRMKRTDVRHLYRNRDICR